MPKVLVERLKVPYPPANLWMAETKEIADLWREEIRSRKLADNRVKSRENLRDIGIVDKDKVQLIVEEDQTRLYVDPHTDELIGITFRDFTSDSKVLQWLDDRAKSSIRWRRGARVIFYLPHLGEFTDTIEA